MDTAANAIIGGGFKLDSAGKLRLNGKMVDKATAAAVESGEIMVGFDMKKLKASKAKKSVAGGKSIVEQINDISPAIGLLKVGMTAKLAMPKSVPDRKGKGGVMVKLDPKRSFVMGVVTKLNSATSAAAEWAGRVFDSASDDAGEYCYVTRMPDTETPHVRKATGVKPGTSSKSSQSLEAALAASKAHLDGKGTEGEGQQQQEGEPVDPGKAADTILDGGEVQTNGGETEVSEEAQVVKH